MYGFNSEEVIDSFLRRIDENRAIIRICLELIKPEVMDMDRNALLEYFRTLEVTKNEFYESYSFLKDYDMVEDVREGKRTLKSRLTKKGQRLVGALWYLIITFVTKETVDLFIEYQNEKIFEYIAEDEEIVELLKKNIKHK